MCASILLWLTTDRADIEFPRTPDVSTTDAIQRVLTGRPSRASETTFVNAIRLADFVTSPATASTAAVRAVDLPPDGTATLSFRELLRRPDSANPSVQVALTREPRPDEAIVYVHGPFDLLDAACLQVLRQASERAFVVVGVWSPRACEAAAGEAPIMSHSERVLGVLQCRYVDALISPVEATPPSWLRTDEAIAVPTTSPAQRIHERRDVFEERQRRKLGKAAVEAGLASSPVVAAPQRSAA